MLNWLEHVLLGGLEERKRRALQDELHRPPPHLRSEYDAERDGDDFLAAMASTQGLVASHQA